MIRNIIWVGLGSMAGGVARYLLSRMVQEQAGGVFPWGTLAVNVLGCLAIGIIYGLLNRGFDLSPELKLFLTVGFCGGFTTFSTFMHENYLLFSGSHLVLVLTYAASSLLLGLLAVYAGYWLARL